MSSIITIVISIALAAAMALAGMYFGGDMFLKGKPEAEAARYINEGQQVSAAIRLYQTENRGELPTDLRADLVGPYLKEMPETSANWNIASDAIVKAVGTTETCESVNKRAGWINPNWSEGAGKVGKHEPIACDDPSLKGETYYCCTAATAN